MTTTETQTHPTSVPVCLVSVLPSLLCTQPNNTSTQPEELHKWPCWLTHMGLSWTQILFFLVKKKKVLTKCCSTTGQVMRLLNKETLRSPQYLVIHTGTNDLHSLWKDTAEAVWKMVEQASKEFPDTHIVILPLVHLPTNSSGTML